MTFAVITFNPFIKKLILFIKVKIILILMKARNKNKKV